MATTQRLRYEIGFAANTQELKRQLQQVKADLNNIANLKFGDGFGSLTNDMSNAALAARQLNNYLEQATNKSTGKLNLNDFRKSIQASGVSLQEYAAKLNAIGPQGQKAFLQVASAVLQADTQVRRSNAALDKMWVTLTNTVRWQISTAAINTFTGAISTAYNYSKDLNESLTNIRIVTGKSVEEMKDFAKYANQAAKQLSTTTTEYTDAALIYYQQGLEEEQVKERTNITIDLANVTGQTAQEVSDQMTAIWNNFDNGSKSLEYYADVLAALGAATASSTEEISEGLEKFAATAETVGLSYEYATAALATVTATTRQSADVVGTAFKTLFSRLEGLQLGETLDDGTTLNKYSQALATVGVNIKDTNGELKDMDDILDELGTRWNKLSEDQQVALAQTVGGTRQYTQLIALMDNWSYFQENLQVALSSEGTVSEQADIYASSWEAASDRVTAAAEGIYQTLVNDEFFIDAADFATGFLDVLNNVLDSMGGFKGILFTTGILLTRLYSNKVVAGITSLGSGFKETAKQAEKANNEFRETTLNIAKGWVSSGKVDTNYVQELEVSLEVADYKKQILELDGRISETQKAQLESLVEQYAVLQKARLELEKMATAGSGYAILDSEEEREIATKTAKTAGKMTGSAVFSLNKTGEATSYKEIQKYFQVIGKEAKQGILTMDAFYKSFEEAAGAKNTLSTLAENLHDTTENGKLTNAQVKEINKTLKNLDINKTFTLDDSVADFKDFAQQVNSAADTALTKFKSKMVEAYKATGVGEQELEEFASGLELIAQKIHAISTEQENASDKAHEASKNFEEALNNTTESVMSAEQLNATLNTVLSIGQGVSTLTSTFSAFSDESLSATDKITQGVSGIGMSIGGAISAAKMLKTAFDGLKISAGWLSVILIGVEALISGISWLYQQEQEELQETIDKAKGMNEALAETKEVVEANQELASSFDDLVEAYDKAIKAGEDTGSIQDELKTTVQQLSEKYDLQGASLAQLTGDYNDYLDVLKQVKEAQKAELAETKETIEETQAAQRSAIIAQAGKSEAGSYIDYSNRMHIEFQDSLFRTSAEQATDSIITETLNNVFGYETREAGQNARYIVDADLDSILKTYDAIEKAIALIDEQYEKFDIANNKIYKNAQKWLDSMSPVIETYRANESLLESMNIASELTDIGSYQEYRSIIGNFTEQLINKGKSNNEAQEIIEAAVALLGGDELQDYNLLDQTIQGILDKGTVFTKEQLQNIFSNEYLNRSALLAIDWAHTTVDSFGEAYIAAKQYTSAIETISGAMSNLQNIDGFDDWSGLLDLENFEELKSAFTWGENGLKTWEEFISLTADARVEYLKFIKAYSYSSLSTGYQDQINALQSQKALLNKQLDGNIDELVQRRKDNLLDEINQTNEAINNAFKEDSIKKIVDPTKEPGYFKLNNSSPISFSLEDTKIQHDIIQYYETILNGTDKEKQELQNNLTSIQKLFAEQTLEVQRSLYDLALLYQQRQSLQKQLTTTDFESEERLKLVEEIEVIDDQINSLTGENYIISVELQYAETLNELDKLKEKWINLFDTISSGISLNTNGLYEFSAEAAEALHSLNLDEQLSFDVTTGRFTMQKEAFNELVETMKNGYDDITRKELEQQYQWAKNQQERYELLAKLARGEATEEEKAALGGLEEVDPAIKSITEAQNLVNAEQDKLFDSTQEAFKEVSKEDQDLTDEELKAISEIDSAYETSYKKQMTYQDELNEKKRKGAYFSLADAYALQGETDSALSWLNAADQQTTSSITKSIQETTSSTPKLIQEAVSTTANVKLFDQDDSDIQPSTTDFNQTLKNRRLFVKKTTEETAETVTTISAKTYEAIANIFENYAVKLATTIYGLSTASDELLETISEISGVAVEALQEAIKGVHELEQELESLEKKLEEVRTKSDKAFGIDRIKLLKEEADLLDEQAKKLEKLAEAQGNLREEYQTQLKATFEEVGLDEVSIDANGDIQNYDQLLLKIREWTSSEDEVTKKKGENLQQLIEWYEEAVDAEKDYYIRLLETGYEAKEKNLETITYELEFRMNIKSMQDAADAFSKKIAESLGDELTHGANALTSSLIQASRDMSITGSILDLNYSTLWGQYNKFSAMLNDPAYYDIRDVLIENLQNIQDEAITTADNLLEFIEVVENALPNAVQAARKRFEQATSQLSHNNTILDTIKELYALQGITNKTLEGYNKLTNISEEKLQVTVNDARLQKVWLENSRTQLAQAYTALAGAQEGTETYDVLKAAYDALLEEYNSAQEAMLSSAKDAMNIAQDIFTQAIERAQYNFEQTVTQGKGFDLLQMKYDNYIDTEERFLDVVTEQYEVNKLNRAIQGEMDKANSSGAAKRLKALQDELKLMSEQGKMSQYDVDLMNAKYEITLKQIALEEAQNAKTQMRLTKDNQGNWTYVYTADSAKISQAQQELEDAQQRRYEIAKEYSTKITSEILNAQQEMMEKLVELENDHTLSEQEYADRRVEIVNYYTQKITELEEEKNQAIEDLYDAGVDIIDGFENTYGNTLDNMTIDSEEFKLALQSYLREAEQAGTDYNNTMNSVATNVGVSLDDLLIHLNDVSTGTQMIGEQTDIMVTKLWGSIPTMTTMSQFWADLAEQAMNYVRSLEQLSTSVSSSLQTSVDIPVESFGPGFAYEEIEDPLGGISGDIFVEQPMDSAVEETEDAIYAQGQIVGFKPNIKLSGDSFGEGGKISVGTNVGGIIKAVNYGNAYPYGIYDSVGSFIGWASANEIHRILAGWDDLASYIPGFKTGGYTGEFDGGRLAMLHEKELVLNEDDTRNMLAAVSVMRSLDSDVLSQLIASLNGNAAASVGLMSARLGGSGNFSGQPQEIIQHVDINASFPGVQTAAEIEQALHNIVNEASQYANRK